MSLIRRRMLWLSAAAASLIAAGAAAQGTGTATQGPASPRRDGQQSNPPRTAGAARRLRLYRLAARRRDGRHQGQGLVRDTQLRRRTRRGDHQEHRPPPSADRRAAAAAGPADSERPQPSALRTGPDRDGDRAAAGHAHAAIADGRCRPCAAQSAGDVPTHHRLCARGACGAAAAIDRLSRGRAPP